MYNFHPSAYGEEDRGRSSRRSSRPRSRSQVSLGRPVSRIDFSNPPSSIRRSSTHRSSIREPSTYRPPGRPTSTRQVFSRRNSSARPPSAQAAVRPRLDAQPPTYYDPPRRSSSIQPPGRSSTSLPTYESIYPPRHTQPLEPIRMVRMTLQMEIVSRRAIGRAGRPRIVQSYLEITERTGFETVQTMIKDELKRHESDPNKCFTWTSWLQFSDGPRRRFEIDTWPEVRHQIMQLTSLAPGSSRWPQRIITSSNPMSTDKYGSLAHISAQHIFNEEDFRRHLLVNGYHFKQQRPMQPGGLVADVDRFYPSGEVRQERNRLRGELWRAAGSGRDQAGSSRQPSGRRESRYQDGPSPHNWAPFM